MNIESTLFLTGAVLCGFFALIATRSGPWRIMLTGVAIATFGSAWGLDLINFGQFRDREFAIGLGQMFMAFSSVVGGALVSVAFVELRAKYCQTSQDTP